MLKQVAERVMAILSEMPEVKGCALYGSLANGSWDDMSDIDIELDLSGCDNGCFALELPGRLGEKISVIYSDYAPSLAPEKYVVSVAIDENNPFRVVDLCCAAEPHCATTSKQQLRQANDEFSHMLKLWTANLKHCLRGADCRGDVLRMAGRIQLPDAAARSEIQILSETLERLEADAPEKFREFLKSCRREFEKRTASK